MYQLPDDSKMFIEQCVDGLNETEAYEMFLLFRERFNWVTAVCTPADVRTMFSIVRHEANLDYYPDDVVHQKAMAIIGDKDWRIGFEDWLYQQIDVVVRDAVIEGEVK